MAKKAKEVKEKNTFRMSTLCGISEKRSHEIHHAVKHAKLDCQTWSELAKMVRINAKIKGEGDSMYLGFLLGKEISINEFFDFLPKHLMGHLKGVGIKVE